MEARYQISLALDKKDKDDLEYCRKHGYKLIAIWRKAINIIKAEIADKK